TNDVFLKRIEKELNVSIITRGEKIQVSGDNPNQVQEILNQLLIVIQEGITITERDVVYVIKLAKEGKTNQFPSLFADVITTNAIWYPISIKTLGQIHYIESMHEHDIVFVH